MLEVLQTESSQISQRTNSTFPYKFMKFAQTLHTSHSVPVVKGYLSDITITYDVFFLLDYRLHVQLQNDLQWNQRFSSYTNDFQTYFIISIWDCLQMILAGFALFREDLHIDLNVMRSNIDAFHIGVKKIYQTKFMLFIQKSLPTKCFFGIKDSY